MSGIDQLQYDGDREANTRISTVVQVISAVIGDVQAISVIPVRAPISRIRVHEQERIAAVCESRIPHVERGDTVQAERVLAPKKEVIAGLRNEGTAVTSTLRPSAMVAIPPLTTALLPGAMSLPCAVRSPSLLLLPRGRLLVCALRLLLFGRLGAVRLLLLRPLLLSLAALLRLLRGLDTFLLLRPLLLSLAAPLGLLSWLRVLLLLRAL